MISINAIRNAPKKVEESLRAKGYTGSINDIVSIDKNFRKKTQNIEISRAKKNLVSEEVARAKRSGKQSEIKIKEMRVLGEEIKLLEKELSKLKVKLSSKLEEIPNLPDKSVPIGVDEKDNVIVREWGKKSIFDFEEKPHLELGKSLNLFDLERGAKISGSGFPLYVGKGAELERKLINSMIEHHVKNYNFIEMFPPVLILEESMKTTGQLPKFKEDMYLSDLDELYLAPTAEVPITNIHRNEIIPESELPISYVAYSPCFRRESGSYGKDTRGLLRLHQFNKVEMVKFVKPVDSYSSLEDLTLQAESILQKLGITYRVVELCTGDLSFAAAKCYDIEIWSPGERQWLEVSSCSNFEDFQSRRGKIRYRRDEDKKVDLLHTLNGSGLATPRLMVALLETYQTQDGRIEFSDSAAEFIGIKEIS
ncbi:MAG: serine--tRNA ligase [bacterium TMED217]|nr:MAG: serine--tRNA ligase [bacterium TMED217]|tara:strand:+ start:35228 stop:36496 length:1269 start_codon:yes stop_codon:yes gene_type:complete